MFLLLLQSILLALALSLPLAAKWQIDLGKAMLGATIAGAAASLAAARVPPDHVAAVFLTQAGVALGLLAAMALYLFHRDPERVPPQDEAVVVSPADGRVLYVKALPGGELPVSYKQGFPFRLEELAASGLLEGGAYLIGVGMNLLDVHVNRAPIKGEVVLARLVPGAALSLKRPEAAVTNTRLTTVIAGPRLSAAVIQITSRLVRHIRPYIKNGDSVETGQRIGMIRFGSQVDLLLPRRPGLKVVCRPQQRVRAGESIIARQEAK